MGVRRKAHGVPIKDGRTAQGARRTDEGDGRIFSERPHSISFKSGIRDTNTVTNRNITHNMQKSRPKPTGHIYRTMSFGFTRVSKGNSHLPLGILRSSI
jgi:hypothetical protein